MIKFNEKRIEEELRNLDKEETVRVYKAYKLLDRFDDYYKLGKAIYALNLASNKELYSGAEVNNDALGKAFFDFLNDFVARKEESNDVG